MVRYLIRFSYIGTKYRGVQSQKEAAYETVEDVLRLALESLRPGNVPRTSLCSRTDKGVHALMNAVHVDLDHRIVGETFPSYVITQGMNRYFRENNHEILTIQTNVVPDTFSARRAAKWRSYIYRLAVLKPEIVYYTRFGETKKFLEQYLPVSEINRCHLVDSSLDVNKVQESLKVMQGLHNFSFFTSGLSKEPWKSPIRSIEKFDFYPAPCQFTSDPQYYNIDMWEFYVRSPGFLYSQVRKMVAAALAVGHGYLTTDDIISMLKKPELVKWTCPEIPPGGLYLSHIQFKEEAFVSPKEEDISDKDLDSS